MKILFCAVVVFLCFATISADLPVHCLWEQIKGDWILNLGQSGFSKDIVNTCQLTTPVTSVKSVRVTLQEPDVVTTPDGSNGFFTMIYDQGFEIVLNNQKFFAFFNYTKYDEKVVSNCDSTFTGWFHDVGVNPSNWGCFRAVKASSTNGVSSKHEYNWDQEYAVRQHKLEKKTFTNDDRIINEIHNSQKSWTATKYPWMEGKSMKELLRSAGKFVPKFRKEAHKRHVQRMRLAKQRKLRTLSPKALPDFIDWRNMTGKNFVSPVRNQQSCGSCYAFATMGQLEARARIQSSLQMQPVYSPQDVVSCSVYSQGCEGGFPYLITKYGEDFGIANEACYPYKGQDSQCSEQCSPRTYVTDYKYVGGFYGATDEQSMMQELVENGPMTIAFMVYRDFFNYKGGVYHHVQSTERFSNPDPHFEETNHAVLLVGYGTLNGEKYWLMKNSWGTNWGMGGYFMIRRGTDECDCESEAVAGKVVM